MARSELKYVVTKPPTDWCEDALRLAYKKALQSPDPSTQNGAFIYDEYFRPIGEGCNTFTRGVKVTSDLLERPKKYTYIEHAERSSLFDVLANQSGKPYIMVVCWAACADCARAIASCGIKYLVRHKREDETGRWGQSIIDGDIIMKAAGVEIIEIEGKLGYCAPVLFDGKLVTP